MIELPDLKNFLLFYVENENFNPLYDLKYIQQMKTAFEQKPAVGYDELSEEEWKKHRIAYKIKKEET